MSVETKHLHRVSWSNGVATFYCDGDWTSPCHQYPDCECETSSAAHEQHPNTPHDDCWALTWLNAVGAEETWFDGGDLLTSMPRVDGPIDYEWDGDGLLWCYVNSDEMAAARV